MPGRCGYWYWPGRGGMPGCCVRTGCDGSGRGPPTGACGREPGYAGRGGGGRRPDAPGTVPGRRHRLPRRPSAQSFRSARRLPLRGRGGAGMPSDGRPSVAARRAARARSAAAASASSAAVLRCAAASVGGTMRPAAGFGGAAGTAWDRMARATAGDAALRPAVSTGSGASSTGVFGLRLELDAASTTRLRRERFDRRGARRLRPRRRLRLRRGTATGRLDGLDQARRRQRGRRRLDRLGRLLRRRALLALDDGRFGEDVAARQRDVALTREALDELARDDFFDGARGALHLDAVIALEQRRDFLARGAEQFRDFVNPDSGQAVSSFVLQDVPYTVRPTRLSRRLPRRRAPPPESSRRSFRRCPESPTAARPMRP